MRIFYAADATPNPSLPSRIWTRNLYYPLLDLGHEVVVFDYDYGDTFRHLDPALPESAAYIAEHRPALEQELMRQVERAHAERPIDFFFSYFYSAVCGRSAIDHIRSLGICTANWYCNASYQFHLIEELAPAYDFCFVPERDRLEDYRRVGARPLYVQEAANPTFYHPDLLSREYPTTFVGQCYGDRPHIVRALLDQRLDVRVFGPGWASVTSSRGSERRRRIADRVRRSLGLRSNDAEPTLPGWAVGPPLSDDELVAMYSRSVISLGFSSCGDTHRTSQRILQIRLRDFEATMSGAFYLVEHFDELGDFFEIGREIVTFATADDLADKIRFYLAHDSAREKIRHAGRLRALGEHTWQLRFQEAFRAMGLPS
jgi:spore maturation protein CgeB